MASIVHPADTTIQPKGGATGLPIAKVTPNGAGSIVLPADTSLQPSGGATAQPLSNLLPVTASPAPVPPRAVVTRR